MNVLIIYDSFFGNTKQVATYYQKEFEKEHYVALKSVKDVEKANIEQFEIIIFGSPTRAFNMSANIKKLLKNKSLPFTNKLVFAFDTRTLVKEGEMRFLVRLMKWFGFAGEKIEKLLIKRKAKIIMKYTFYYVLDSEGPLEESVQEKVVTDCELLKQKIKELAH